MEGGPTGASAAGSPRWGQSRGFRVWFVRRKGRVLGAVQPAFPLRLLSVSLDGDASGRPGPFLAGIGLALQFETTNLGGLAAKLRESRGSGPKAFPRLVTCTLLGFARPTPARPPIEIRDVRLPEAGKERLTATYEDRQKAEGSEDGRLSTVVFAKRSEGRNRGSNGPRRLHLHETRPEELGG